MPYFLYDIQFHSVIANYMRISFKSNFFIFSFYMESIRFQIFFSVSIYVSCVLSFDCRR